MTTGVSTIRPLDEAFEDARVVDKAVVEEPKISKKARNTITLAATLGYLFDAYAINIYGMTLALIALDFDVSIQTMGLIGSIFIAGYMLGSCVFGMLGDRFGRKHTLGFSIFAYGSVTALTGLALTPVQFAIGRFLTGVGGGGELTVGVPYVVESWDSKHRGFGAGLMFAGYALGVVYAALVSALILEWLGWRAMYFLAVLPAIIILFVRMQLEESPSYLATMEKLKQARRKRASFWSSLKASPALRRNLGWGSLIYVSLACIYYAETVFAVPFMVSQLKMSTTAAVATLGLFNLSMFVFSIGCGALSDKIGRKSAGASTLIVLATSLWVMFSTTSIPLFVIFGILAFGGIGGSWAIGMVHVAELFPTEIRGSGFGWSVALGRFPSIFAPLGIAWLASVTPGGMGDAMKYSCIVLLCALLAYLFGPESLGRSDRNSSNEMEDLQAR
ncbi:MFS transporter [Methylobacterium nodulans]|uniref:Major facilitator superfamily MFS_1 n=1 Tax=Methylobacterium nodulans (strain LMG 21967 / CNCM I-2342 / ORS 2060) TaxID=460265 RepID=B8IFC5_METNO|nr:MFS transporter [Methylobacterium nodulans]ACL57660.1 major facilitator superfamily MFS_1 [Methylobacterium nodulans ORS 2060]